MNFALLMFGMLLSFVITTLERDHRLQRPSPVLVRSVGYVLVGALMASAVILIAFAAGGGISLPA
ncbi:MAG: hypothetical protein U5M50_05185 [Sphingobium sp.]|nr:hypothetical protein [Sphingobium sp.]